MQEKVVTIYLNDTVLSWACAFAKSTLILQKGKIPAKKGETRVGIPIMTFASNKAQFLVHFKLLTNRHFNYHNDDHNQSLS